MKSCQHKHLVTLYAVCSQDEPILIVTELMPNGSLLNYLRDEEGSKLPLDVLINMSCQVTRLVSQCLVVFVNVYSYCSDQHVFFSRQHVVINMFSYCSHEHVLLLFSSTCSLVVLINMFPCCSLQHVLLLFSSTCSLVVLINMFSCCSHQRVLLLFSSTCSLVVLISMFSCCSR